MSAQALHDLSLHDVASLLERREASPVELTRASLDRIERLDPRLSSYLLVLRERALAAAQRAEAESRAGHAYQRATSWHTPRPPIA